MLISAPLMHDPVRGRRTAEPIRAAAPRRAASTHAFEAGACACGGGCPRCAGAAAGLRVSRRGDADESAAEAMANAVLARDAAVPSGSVPLAPATDSRAVAAAGLVSGGEALAADVRADFESRFHADFSAVRIHRDSGAAARARRLHAAAFTVGRHIAFGAGRYAPSSAAGRRLLAHELAHVAQDARGAVPAIRRQEAQGEWLRPFTGSPEFQLRLDPEIEAMMLHHYLRWWIGTALTEGDAPAETEETSADEESAGTAGASAAPPVLTPLVDSMPLAPDFLRPIAPGLLAPEPDWAAIMAPYNQRMVPYGNRDPEAAGAIFQANWRFVSVLPDIRDLAPGFIRPLIPSDWRRSMAAAFTAATLNAQLRRDWMTPLEAADYTFFRMTGVSTTYIPLPSFSF